MLEILLKRMTKNPHLLSSDVIYYLVFYSSLISVNLLKDKLFFLQSERKLALFSAAMKKHLKNMEDATFLKGKDDWCIALGFLSALTCNSQLKERIIILSHIKNII